MKEPNWKTADENEAWQYVASYLKAKGIDTILVGGKVQKRIC